MEIKAAVTALGALAQETRLSIYRLLVEAGREGESVGRIGETLKVPGATLSFHLKELTRAGLLTARQDRQFIYYAVDFERMPQECLTVVETALGRCCPPQSKSKKPKLKRSGS
jgi:DNA-binding transcriptional ArsR family regulator